MTARECIIPVFVPHLGCPHACVFCNQRRITGQQQPATAQTVHETVDKALRLLPGDIPKQLAFYGGSFTAISAASQEELLSAAKEYLDRKEIESIRLSTRPDAIDDSVLSRLRRFGVKTIEIGAQSMNDQVLLLSGRGHTASDVEIASEKIKKAGFQLILQMMTGLPGDTKEIAEETAKQIISLSPDGVRIYPTVIIKDTELYDLWKSGQYEEHTVEEAVSVCAEILPLFEAAKISVIRLGLNPTDELSSGTAAGGAYHPALGELVRSRIYRNHEEKLLREQNVLPGSKVVFLAPENRFSQAIGQHRCNAEWLKEQFHLEKISFASEGKDTEICLASVEKG